MNYTGKLYGKIGRKTIPLAMTAEECDRIRAALMEIETVSDNGIRSGRCQCVACRVWRIAKAALTPQAERE